MWRDVAQHASPRLREILAPVAHGIHRELGCPAEREIVGAPYLAPPDALPHLGHDSEGSQVETHEESTPSCLCGTHHGFGVRDREGERLLAEHIAPCLEGGDRDIPVRIVRRRHEHEHEVEIVTRNEGVIGALRLHAEAHGEVPSAFGRTARYRDEVGARAVADRARHELGMLSEADDPDAHGHRLNASAARRRRLTRAVAFRRAPPRHFRTHASQPAGSCRPPRHRYGA